MSFRICDYVCCFTRTRQALYISRRAHEVRIQTLQKTHQDLSTSAARLVESAAFSFLENFLERRTFEKMMASYGIIAVSSRLLSNCRQEAHSLVSWIGFICLS